MKFRVRLVRDTTESADVCVEALDREDAAERAIALADDSSIDWETDSNGALNDPIALRVERIEL